MNGKQRAIVENISPEIDHGRFYAKGVTGDSFRVEADIFTDGHDLVRGKLLYKHESDKNWAEKEFIALNNDRWYANFVCDKPGYYTYTVIGWVDHFLSWQQGFEKKFKDGQAMDVELKIGTEFLTSAKSRAGKIQQKSIQNLIDLFADSRKQTEAINAVMGKEVEGIILNFPHLENAVRYDKELKVYADREKAVFSSWYSFFPRSASAKPGKHGTFKDCEKLLPRIAEMGFDVLYFPPIHPIGELNRKGKNNAVNAKPGEPGVPYAIGSKLGGHKDIHPELGTLKDFKNLVKKAADNGLEVALDFAIQCAPDHPYINAYPQWFKHRPDGAIQYAENPPKKYQDIVPINFETEYWQNLWDELKSILVYWCNQGIRIFRVDNPHTKSFNFWEWVIAEVQREFPGTLFLAEAFTKPKVMQQLAKGGYSQSYTYFTWRNSKQELTEYMLDLTQSEMKDYFRPNFWPNTHDINPYALQSGLESLFLSRLFMAATLSSNYGIFGPVYELMVNAAYPGKEEYLDSEKYEIQNWDWAKRNKLMYVIGLVNKARKENKALQRTNNIALCKIENDQLFAYYKSDGDKNHILCVVNLDPYSKQSGTVQTPFNRFGKQAGEDFVVHDLVTGSKYIWNKEWNYVELVPHNLPFHLFRIENNA